MSPIQDSVDLIQVSEGDAFSVVNYFHVFTESPDSQHVAYTRFPDGPHENRAGRADVVVCDRDGKHHRCVGRVLQATQHRGAYPTWIDDQHLAYSWTGDVTGPVHVVNLDTGDERIYDGGLDNYSPALDRTYFTDAFDGAPAVWYLDLATGERNVAVTMDRMQAFALEHGYTFGPEALAHAYITPDGHRIAFRVGREEECVIILADPDGSNLEMFGRKMMHWQFYDDASFFGHDDVYAGDKHMRRWDFSGNVVEELSGPGCHGTISPDGQWIVTESWYRSDPVDIFLYRRGEVKPTCILARTVPPWNTRAHVHPSFSRDGKRVYFNYNVEGSRGSQVYCCDLDAFI